MPLKDEKLREELGINSVVLQDLPQKIKSHFIVQCVTFNATCSLWENHNIHLLKAQACGTPVLATSVSGILDLINDGGTGFIKENNSPECITENVIRPLEHPDLDRIMENKGDGGAEVYV